MSYEIIFGLKYSQKSEKSAYVHGMKLNARTTRAINEDVIAPDNYITEKRSKFNIWSVEKSVLRSEYFATTNILIRMELRINKLLIGQCGSSFTTEFDRMCVENLI